MKWLAIISALALTGCTMTQGYVSKVSENPPTVQENPMVTDLHLVPTLDGPVITIGVYSFTDKTGQRKPADSIANLSSAVTQGAEVWVIDALLEAGKGTWFEVVERVSMTTCLKRGN